MHKGQKVLLLKKKKRAIITANQAILRGNAESVKNQFYQVISLIAVAAYFVPIVIVLIKKLWHVTPFVLFACYWLIGGVVNMVDFIPVSKRVTEVFTVIYNTIDMPVVLAIIYMTTSSASIKKFTKIVGPAFAVLELVNLFVRGVNYDALKYTLALGLILVLTVILWEIILYLQRIEHTGLQKGLLFIYASLLFEYGTYIVIYIFDYYLEDASTTTDNFLVYYVSTVVAIIIATCGFLTKTLNSEAGSKNTEFRMPNTEFRM